MSTPTSDHERAVADDAPIRARIGPWSKRGAADLSAFDADTNYFVRAAAGSGKTTSLVARMVALVRQGVPVDEITAITFTRKAAGEMSARFFAELQRTRQALEPASEERARVEAALQNVQQAFIGTVHAFCARLLRERPLAAGLPPDFTAGIEPRDERDLQQSAWQRYLQNVHEEQPERMHTIIELGLEPNDLFGYFMLLCGHPDLEPYVNAPERMPDLRGAVDAASARLRAWQEQRPEALSNGRDRVMKALDKAENALRYQDLDSPSAQAGFLELFAAASSDERAKVTLKCWGARGSASYNWARSLRDDLFPALIRDTIRPVLRRWRAFVHARVVAFTRPAVKAYQELRRREGLLTFHDLLLHTRDLLRDLSGIREAFQQRYTHLLVDEFQDTDPLQAEMLFYLTSSDPTERDWRQCHPRPGSLFIVGDDKQSIYRFRRADKDVFDTVARLVEASGGAVVDLTKNFRSRAAICDWCDEAFTSIFAEPELAALQANYIPFDAQRPSGEASTTLRRIVIGDVWGNRDDEIAQRDAEQIAGFIRAAMAGKADSSFYGDADDDATVFQGAPQYGDFLLLTRNKARLGTYASALAAHDVPYTITGSEDLGTLDELKAIVDVMRCAMRPDDPVAAVAYLKGLLVGCSDDDLYRFVRAGGTFDCMHEPVEASVLENLDEGGAERFAAAFGRLRKARKTLREKRPGTAIEHLVERLGLLAEAAHPDVPAEGALRAGYVLRVVSYVQHLSARGLGWAEVLEELQRVLDGEEDVDGMTLETGRDDVVRVMNVHQAKGLEASVVFLADPYSRGGSHQVWYHVRRESGELVAPVVQGESHYRRVTHAPLGWHDDSDKAFRALEVRHGQAEERRLLYVAATRARNLLVVSTYPKKENDGYWSALYPFLDDADVPELQVPAVTTDGGFEAPDPNLAHRREERRRRIDAAQQPSYHVAAVTDAKESVDFRLSMADGYGEAFGTAVHMLFERCLHDRSNGAFRVKREIHAALEAAGLEASEERARRARAMVEGLRASKLWTDIQEADVVYSEYPVARAHGDAPQTLVRGSIDLVYCQTDGWVIVDFKSDRVDPDRLDALSDDHPYCTQVRAYVELWEDIVGEPVVCAGLWFADAERFVAVDRKP